MAEAASQELLIFRTKGNCMIQDKGFFATNSSAVLARPVLILPKVGFAPRLGMMLERAERVSGASLKPLNRG
jgi:hypothetical protein